jgi:molybdate transport system substrate-binding protein
MPKFLRDLKNSVPRASIADVAVMVAAVLCAAGLPIFSLTALPPLSALVAPAHAQTRDVVVFGAIVFKEALDEANDAFRVENGTKAVATYGATAMFLKQIESGEPADVFLAGDLATMDSLAERNLIKPETRRTLLGNRLVLIAPASSSVTLTVGPDFPLVQALGNGRLAIPAENTPAGRYTKLALDSLGVWPSLAGKVAVSGGSRAILTQVARGEVALGIVWQTDAEGEKDVTVVATLPESSHPPIVYPMAVLANSTNALTSSYVQYLLSQKAAAIFGKRGFAVY